MPDQQIDTSILTQLSLLIEKKIQEILYFLVLRLWLLKSMFIGCFQPDYKGLYVSYIQESTQEQAYGLMGT